MVTQNLAQMLTLISQYGFMKKKIKGKEIKVCPEKKNLKNKIINYQLYNKKTLKMIAIENYQTFLAII